MKKNLCVGIDPGTNTGLAVWVCEENRFMLIKTVKIHQAFAMIQQLSRLGWVHVRVEDARLRTWFGKSGREKLQGAGSIKRDSVIWDDFLSELKSSKIIEDYELVSPKNNLTKLSSTQFRNISKFVGATSEHGRDAAMLCINYQPSKQTKHELQPSDY